MTTETAGHDSLIGQALGHYRIIERIGGGGMGVVYRGHDRQLDRDVALKILPAGSLEEEAARSRFRKEALALGKLNHPNIETVYEFGSANGVDYLAMELIPGETLHARLVSGSISNRETLRLGIQLAEGLDAAHAQGIIHRDLKPGNVMLLPDGRLKILDFGLAHLVRPGLEQDIARTISETTSFSGTLPYMSPEQLKGLPADARSDIFSAGAVLYEMITARKPFPQSQSAELIGAIIYKEPATVSSLNAHVTPALATIIHKCLEKNPPNRYQSARELRAALEAAGDAAIVPTGEHRRWPFLWATSTILVVLLTVGSLFGLNIRGLRDRVLHSNRAENRSTTTTSAATKPRRSVAVLGFKNLSGRPDLAWLSTALSEMLITELAVSEELRTIPGETVSQMKVGLALPEADSFGKETLLRIRQNLGADDVVLGSYVPIGNGLIRLDLRLQDAAAGETVASISEKGAEAQLDEVVSRAGEQLRAKLGVSGLSESQSLAVKGSLPSSPEAARFYAEGLSRFRVFDYLGARDLLSKAVALEPNFSLSHGALASAWKSLGFDEKAKQEAAKAFELSTGFPREERLLVEARYRESTNEWDKAAEIYSSLFSFFPDNLEYGLQLVRSQISAGKTQEAASTIELLRKFSPLQRDDPRIDLMDARAASILGDFARMEASSARAAAKGQALASVLIVAEARLDQCRALRHLGRPKEAITVCQEARGIYAGAGDRGGAADALTNIANSYYDQGDLAQARKFYDETLATYREIGNKRGVAGALDNIANVVGDLGDLAAAKKLSNESLSIYREVADYTGMGETLNNIAAEDQIAGDYKAATKAMEEALEIWQRTGNKNGTAVTLNNLGDMLLEQGELTQAESKYQEALKIWGVSGQRTSTAYPMLGLAEVLSARGDLTGAREKYQEILVIAGDSNDKHLSASALSGMGKNLVSAGDLSAARQKHEEALEIRKEIGEKENAAESVLALASVALEEGHLADADKLAQSALQEFQKEKLQGDEILARVVLARSLLAQRKPPESHKQMELAAKLVAKSPMFFVRMEYAITAAVVKAAEGWHAEATSSLEASLTESRKRSCLECQYKAELALGEIEVNTVNGNAGRTRLNALEHEAVAHGYLLIARKAAAAARASS